MGASESKIREQFLWCIVANKEGRVNELVTVSYHMQNPNFTYRLIHSWHQCL